MDKKVPTADISSTKISSEHWFTEQRFWIIYRCSVLLRNEDLTAVSNTFDLWMLHRQKMISSKQLFGTCICKLRIEDPTEAAIISFWICFFQHHKSTQFHRSIWLATWHIEKIIAQKLQCCLLRSGKFSKVRRVDILLKNARPMACTYINLVIYLRVTWLCPNKE